MTKSNSRLYSEIKPLEKGKMRLAPAGHPDVEKYPAQIELIKSKKSDNIMVRGIVQYSYETRGYVPAGANSRWQESKFSVTWIDRTGREQGKYFADSAEGEEKAQKFYNELTKNDEKAMEASDLYTNKSKKVKLIFYANRSTAQTCKPGQTVHPKAGYGRRTKVRDATPEEVKQLKAGKWLRTRESGKGPDEKGSKKTRYRSLLTAAFRRIEAMEALND